MKEDSCCWCNYNLNWRNRRSNVFRRKQRTNKEARNIFRHFKLSTKVRLMFWRTKDRMKGKCYVFSGYKQWNELCFFYLECKLQQDSYGWCFSKLKFKGKVKKTKFREKETTNILNYTRKSNNYVFQLCQQTSKVECIYSVFKNLKISSKKCQQRWKL